MSKVFIITQNDLVYCPPTQTLIMLMLKKGLDIYFIGKFSDYETKKEYESLGVVFKDIVLDEKGNFLQKLVRRKIYTRDIDLYLKKSSITTNDLVWYIYIRAQLFVVCKCPKSGPQPIWRVS